MIFSVLFYRNMKAWRCMQYFQGQTSFWLAEFPDKADLFFPKKLGVLRGSYPAGKAAWEIHLTEVAVQLWQVLLFPDLVTVWNTGIYRPPSCLWIISVNIVSWTVIGYKQSKQIKNLESLGFGELLSSNQILLNMETFVDFARAFSFTPDAYAFFLCFFLSFFLICYVLVEMIVLLLVHKDGPWPIQVSHWFRIHPKWL